MSTEKVQDTKAKKGEIAFRSKVFRKETLERDFLEDNVQTLKIIRDRVKKSDLQFAQLLKQKVVFSPFLEIGAERCQRSMLLTDKYEARGFALDISFYSLKSATYYSRILGMKLPIRVCADAYHLPFRNNSFSFVFCYETLHHFPSPAPIIREIYRVMKNGHFFFDEEGTSQAFNLKLYKRFVPVYDRRPLLQKVIEHFVTIPVCNETLHGIIENRDIAIARWMRDLQIFDGQNVELYVPKRLSCVLSPNEVLINCRLDSNAPMEILKRLIISTTGGIIRALCWAASKPECPSPKNLLDLLGCPSCWIEKGAIRDRAPLVFNNSELTCTNCSESYPVVDGIFMLLPKEEKNLYLELSKPQFGKNF